MASTETTNFTRIIEEICQAEGLDHRSFSGDWCHRIEKEGRVFFVVGYQFPLNPGASRDLCQDKVLTYQVLTEAGIPAVPHYFLSQPDMQIPEKKEEARKLFASLLSKQGKVVLKDNYGTGGNRVYLIENETDFQKTLESILAVSFGAALSEYQEIQEEYRVILLQGKAVFAFRKQRAFRLDDQRKRVYLNWRHNLGQGAKAVKIHGDKLTKTLYRMGEEAAEALKMGFCSVDLVRTRKGFRVLEVNAGVMMEHLAGQGKEFYRIAREIYREAILLSLESSKKSDDPQENGKKQEAF